jgi:ribosomal protein S18 acetylase RimI-like enzyme
MNAGPVDFDREDCDALQDFLAERVYEFNARAIGRFNGKLLGAAIRDTTGEIVAAISGHTWAGCCQVTYLWVRAEHRGGGLGRRLLRAAEAEAKRRDCVNLIVSSHSFQAPGFYEHLGYKKHAVVLEHPVGHSNIFFVKALVGDGA